MLGFSDNIERGYQDSKAGKVEFSKRVQDGRVASGPEKIIDAVTWVKDGYEYRREQHLTDEGIKTVEKKRQIGPGAKEGFEWLIIHEEIEVAGPDLSAEDLANQGNLPPES